MLQHSIHFGLPIEVSNHLEPSSLAGVSRVELEQAASSLLMSPWMKVPRGFRTESAASPPNFKDGMFRNYQCSNFLEFNPYRRRRRSGLLPRRAIEEQSSTFRGGACLASANLGVRRPHLRRRGRNFKAVAQYILWPVNAEPPLTPTLIADRACQICK